MFISVDGVSFHQLWERFFFYMSMGRNIVFMITMTILMLTFVHLILTFSKHNQAIEIIFGNFRMVTNELVELRLETIMEKE